MRLKNANDWEISSFNFLSYNKVKEKERLPLILSILYMLQILEQGMSKLVVWDQIGLKIEIEELIIVFLLPVLHPDLQVCANKCI